jgi:hypothetical protein
LISFGVKLEEDEDISKGYGDSVCFVINELLNFELYRQSFKFGVPRQDCASDEDEVREVRGEESDDS